MIKLERINGETCVEQIRAMRSCRATDQEEKCKYVCTPENYPSCERYKPIGVTQERFAHLRLYGK